MLRSQSNLRANSSRPIWSVLPASSANQPFVFATTPAPDVLTLSDGELLQAIAWRSKWRTEVAAAPSLGQWLANTSAVPKLAATGSGDPLQMLLWETSHVGQLASACEQFVGEVNCGSDRPTTSGNAADELERALSACNVEPWPHPLDHLRLLTIVANERDHLPPDILSAAFRSALRWSVEHHRSLDIADVDARQTASEQLHRYLELPRVIGHVFGAIEGASALAKQATAESESLVDAFTDADGTPHYEVAGDERETAAVLLSLVRSVSFDVRPRLPKPTRRRMQACVERMVGLTSLSHRHEVETSAVAAFNPPKSSTLRRSGRCGASSGDSLRSGRSSWAGVATLHAMRRAGAIEVVSTGNSSRSATRLSVGGQTVLAGWEVEFASATPAAGNNVGDVSLTPVPTTGDWLEVCWFCDREADYVEWQMRVPEFGVRLTRQVMLAKEDRLLYLAANIANEEGAAARRLRVRQQFRFGEVETQLDLRDRLVWLRRLTDDHAIGRLIPLGMTADKLRPAGGEFSLIDRAAVVEVENPTPTAAGGLCSAVAIDLSKKRRVTPIDWERLTVAEFGRACPASRAAAWRLRSGKSQWLFYQSLTPPTASRTVLGMHTDHEAVFGRFSEGLVQPLVSVEAADE